MKQFSFLVFLILFICTPSAAAPRQTAQVSEVLSGDSIRLSGGKILKYIGIQSPALQSKNPLIRQYGESALKYNQSLVGGKTLQIEWDSQIRDNQGRLLGYVFLEDGTFVNKEMLLAGHAKAVNKTPNIRYTETLRKADLDARRKNLGLWKNEPENPFIKSEYIGNVNTKIFYLPTSPDLEGMPEAHTIKFRSRVDAIAAGYRPCPDCRQDDQELV